MKKRYNKLFSFSIFAIIASAVAWLAVTQPAVAQSLDFPTNFADFATTDIKVAITNIVRIVLGFVGIVFVLLILAGGIIWMTSGGSEDKINRAKKIIVAAVLGLLITLSAYSIASFIIRSLQQATGDGGTSGPPGPGSFPPGGWPDCPIPGPGIVKICEITGGASPGSSITIRGYNFEAYDGPPTDPEGLSKVFFNDGATDIEAELIQCSGVPAWGLSQIRAIVPSSLGLGTYTVKVQAASGERCDDANLSTRPPDCKTHTISTMTSPSIYCVNPEQATADNLDNGPEIIVTGRNFSASGRVQMEGAAGPFDVPDITSWTPEEIRYDFPADAPNPDRAITGYIVVYDSSNMPSDGVEFIVSCSDSSGCASGCCFSNQCRLNSVCAEGAAGGPQAPFITSITPNDGEEGNYITISGRNFGAAPGTLTFAFNDSSVPQVTNSLAECTENWSPTQIIMKVPDISIDNDVNGPAEVWVTALVDGTPTNSNRVGFTVTDTTRPGLCSVTPAEGIFQRLFTIEGNNFSGTSRNIFFGSPPATTETSAGAQSYDTTAPPPDTASGRVPNLNPANTTIGVSIDGENSNPLFFRVLSLEGSPVVNSVTPDDGNIGTYVTISGSGFGTSPGQVIFRNASNVDVLGSNDFPAQCSTSYWTNNNVVIKVPPALGANGDYFVIVRNNATGRISQDELLPGVNAFEKNSSAVRPGLCALSQLSGNPRDRITYFGENFGDEDGKVWFHDTAEAGYSSPFTWNNQQIFSAEVPDAAVTGGTYVVSSVLENSNPLPFLVGSCANNLQCGEGNTCCNGICRAGSAPDVCDTGANYEENNWQFTSGEEPFGIVISAQCSEDIQSPTPFPYHQVYTRDGEALTVYDPAVPEYSAPTKSVIAARFTRSIQYETITANVKVLTCNTGQNFGGSASCASEASGTLSPLGSHGFKWTPNGGEFAPDQWYEVRFDNGTPVSFVQANDGNLFGGSQLLGDLGSVDAFRWHFRTRAGNQTTCEVSNVVMSPATGMTLGVGQTSAWMSASPVNAQCYICGGSYTYSWEVDSNPLQPWVDFTPIDPPPPTINRTKFIGRTITGNPPAPVEVRATVDAPNGLVGPMTPAQLTVNAQPPRVLRFSPTAQCSNVPINVAPYVEFNMTLAGSEAAIVSEVDLYECSTPNCLAGDFSLVLSVDKAVDDPLEPRRVTLRPQSYLAGGRWHRVIVRPGIQNTQGQSLDFSGSNAFDADGLDGTDSYSWVFQTTLEAAEPNSIHLVPSTAVIPSLGGKKRFTASAISSDTVCGEINLNANSYQWNWSETSLGAIATIAGFPQATSARADATGISKGVVTVQASIPDPIPVATAELHVSDSRDLLDLIGHRPDMPPGSTPPENPDGTCELNGNPADCPLQCTNVLVSAIFSAPINSQSITSSIPAGAIGQWSFNVGTAQDNSGNGNHGIFQDHAAPTSGNGAFPGLGRGAVFDGLNPADNTSNTDPLVGPPYIASVGDAVRIADDQAKLAPTEGLTVATWVNLHSVPTGAGHHGFISKRWGSWGLLGVTGPCTPRCNIAMLVFHERGYNALNQRFDVRTQADTGNILPAGEWHHIVGTVDATTRRIKIYVDGILKKDKAFSGGSPSAICGGGNSVLCKGDDELLFGQQWVNPDVIDGELDEVYIYDRALSSAEVQALYTGTQGLATGKFTVVDVATGQYVPGTVAVRNYTDTQGVCTLAPNVPCSPLAQCGDAQGRCSYKRGRLDFYPAGGAYDRSTQYEVRLCQDGSCTISPLRSTQGIIYDEARTWGFTSGDQICKISFVDIVPNPAVFSDRQFECYESTPADPQCLPPSTQEQDYKQLTAYAREAGGSELTGVTYEWRKTSAFSGPYSSEFYELDQPDDSLGSSAVEHKGIIGTDVAEVTAEGEDPALNLGTVTATGQLRFTFCENPWIGTGANTAYYVDSAYDFRLSYCRDAEGNNPSNPAGMLPSLPNPHIVRSGLDFGGERDLLKEHVFVVGTDNAEVGSLGGGAPVFSAPPMNPPALEASYRYGDLVYFQLQASDPDGDRFTYLLNGEGDDEDNLPASASFNNRTGVFAWVVDAIPADDDNDDGKNDYTLNFSLSPGGASMPPVFINIEPLSGSTSAPVRPTVAFVSAANGSNSVGNGGTLTVDYGATVSFRTSVLTYADPIRSFVWDFQDSGLTTYNTALVPPAYGADHLFVQPGTHQVTFRAQDSSGAWSLPAVVNIVVRQRTSSLSSTYAYLQDAEATKFNNLLRGVQSLFGRSAVGQATVPPPQNITATSIGENADIQLRWVNGGVYSQVRILRDGVNITTPALSGNSTTYTDTNTSTGAVYSYSICGVVGSDLYCSDVQATARNVDFDIIVARVYRNTDHLSIREWYENYAPNPFGSPSAVLVDGYPAIQDGTSVYIGMANCVNKASCAGANSIYTNVLLLSYNAGARQQTLNIFSQLLKNLKINDSLTTSHINETKNSWLCSGNRDISCDEGHDAECALKNAGLCMSPKAELRRDYIRVVDLSDMADKLNDYARVNRFCNDGTNNRACNTDADCPVNQQCAGVFPSLASGSYLPGLTTSQWPSWNENLGRSLASTLPQDPVNRFGANFYRTTPPPDSCSAFLGFDPATCWNDRSAQFQCHAGSLVYMYRGIAGNTNYQLLSQTEASGWALNWAGIDTNRIKLNPGNLICNESPTGAVCGNGLREAGEACDGGSRNYCDWQLGQGNWNNEFSVGCTPPGSPNECQWNDPFPGQAVNLCGGACGTGETINAPYEQCDPSASPTGAEAYQCTLGGGQAYCNSACRVACTQGAPYGGSCGNERVELPEVCDDGAQNGAPGRCNRSCTGYGAYCGDGALTPLVETRLGCLCDTPPPSCPDGFTAISGEACSLGGCTSAHQWSCVSNVEECDSVSGLTSYSCPANASLYCDANCNRACTGITTAGGNRTSIAVYEHHFSQGTIEDHDYTLLKKASVPYATRAISFYANPVDTGAGGPSVYRYRYTAGNGIVDYYLSTNASDSRGGTQFGRLFEAAATTAANAVPVYEFRVQKAGGDIDHYYSRNSVPRVDSSGSAYVPLGIAFYGFVGPLQEACGNGIIEGNETCEPSTFQTPLPIESSVARQYACGEALTPNACRSYGGYCGDSVRNQPFEQCDEGPMTCSGDATRQCVTNSDCAPGQTCGGRCSNNATTVCTTDIQCPGGTCVGNGASCNNSAENCTYCVAGCSQRLLARNYCGDGSINPGLNGVPGDGDPYEEVCDDGSSNGQQGYCNDTCSGLTGAICGNGGLPELGEACDDGGNNGRWSNTSCSNNAARACQSAADCSGGATCTGPAAPYCSFSCLGPTPARCGDSVVQEGENCDSGPLNGQPNQCNTTCSAVMPAVCGDGVEGVGETCDFGPNNGIVTVANCTDASNGKPGLQRSGCSVTCQDQATQCHAYGLKIWADGAEVAYINGELAIKDDGGSGAQCSEDPDLQGANYQDPYSPTYLNACSNSVSSVPYSLWTNPATDPPTDLRPIDASGNSVAVSLERAGGNAVAVKVWALNSGATRGFQAVYVSQSVNEMFETKAGQESQWACTQIYTPGWNQITCPKECSTATGYTGVSCTTGDSVCGTGEVCRSRCDPNYAPSNWRKSTSFTNSDLSSDQLCNEIYPNYVGGSSRWVWGPLCQPQVTYCRMVFGIDLGDEPNYQSPSEFCGDGIRNGSEMCDNGTDCADGLCNGTCPRVCSNQCQTNTCGGTGGGGAQPGCFAAGTQVLTPAGLINIESLSVGDDIIAYDEVSKTRVFSKVQATRVTEQDHYYLINGSLKVTAEHEFAVMEGNGIIWKEVQDLKLGDVLVSTTKTLRIVSIERINLADTLTVYNPAMTYPHTYYVIMNGTPVLVHNKYYPHPY